MGMTTKFLEIKFCKTCKENLNYKKFREVKRLTKGPNKGKTVDEIRKAANFYDKLLKNK
jgi:hypothetical protein